MPGQGQGTRNDWHCEHILGKRSGALDSVDGSFCLVRYGLNRKFNCYFRGDRVLGVIWQTTDFYIPIVLFVTSETRYYIFKGYNFFSLPSLGREA